MHRLEAGFIIIESGGIKSLQKIYALEKGEGVNLIINLFVVIVFLIDTSAVFFKVLHNFFHLAVHFLGNRRIS